jgi:GDPmannose 4,6-dehydratase
MKNIALITGITGQDGSYLAEFLLGKGYEVHGILRRSSSFNTKRIDHIFHRVQLHYGDMTDGSSLTSIISKIRPTEIYNLAAQSHVMVSFEQPDYTAQSDGLGVLRLLEAVRLLGMTDTTRIYQASTSEMFGSSPAPQNELTPFHPCSPYGSAKLYSHWICDNYRKSYRMHISSGILFNHESPRRGETFITRKVTKGVARIFHGKQQNITIGNLEAKRDWGHARDYVEGMWVMLQQDIPDDYVISTGVCHTVRHLVEYSFSLIDMKISWEGDSAEMGYDQDGIVRVITDTKYVRPNEVDDLRGDSSKILNKLGWRPRTNFNSLIEEMVDHDILSSGD